MDAVSVGQCRKRGRGFVVLVGPGPWSLTSNRRTFGRGFGLSFLETNDIKGLLVASFANDSS